ncbi:MAG TPA: methyltransferase domain-containing protein [Balneolales bacterium]|nr:methyltransferase domain-containing protein [Balneolales bacterium]
MNETIGHTVSMHRFATIQDAFDGVAAIYDGPFGNNSLIQRIREMVWTEILNRAPVKADILDLGCGTGIDAVHLAGLGYRVWAVDGSANMVMKTIDRVAGQGLSKQVLVKQAGFHELSGTFDNRFDLIYSNFGALNCVSNIRCLAKDCAGLLQPGGLLIVNVMGKYCPWEVGYYLLHGHPRRAFVRWSNRFRQVPLGKGKVWTKYYSPQQWYRFFADRFRLVGYRGMSVAVPPPYLESWGIDHPELFGILDRLDEKLTGMRFFRNMGDHFLMTLRLK